MEKLADRVVWFKIKRGSEYMKKLLVCRRPLASYQPDFGSSRPANLPVCWGLPSSPRACLPACPPARTPAACRRCFKSATALSELCIISFVCLPLWGHDFARARQVIQTFELRFVCDCTQRRPNRGPLCSRFRIPQEPNM